MSVELFRVVAFRMCPLIYLCCIKVIDVLGEILKYEDCYRFLSYGLNALHCN